MSNHLMIDLPCTHPALLTISGRPGWLWCPTCDATLPEEDT